MREDLRARGVELVVAVPEDLPTLRIDPGQIRQVLLNLTRNAAEAMPEGGTISIAAHCVRGDGQLGNSAVGEMGSESRSELGAPSSDRLVAKLPSCQVADWVEVAVTDTGVGIPPGDLGQIFEPFFTRKEGGTGLGLAISREIAVGHGGTLACESAPGQGSTFRLTLPVVQAEGVR